MRLRLDVVPDSEPIAGTLLAFDGRIFEFCGWIELTQAVDAVRRGHPPGQPPVPGAG
mgnify:CR=1 FL=1